jgi:predicted outer membrane protein
MQKKKVLKGLLAVSAVAAMFSTFGVQAQAGAQSSSTNMTGKTTSQGTVGNTNSQGMDNRGGSTSGTSGAGMDQSSGSSSSQGASGSGAAASGGAATSAASSAAGGSMSKSDKKALVDMAQANMAEIEAGKLAQSKSQSDQVKTFAQQMIDDHTKALNDVQQLAQQKGVTLPSEPNSQQKAMMAKLEKMTGNAFDKTYMEIAGVSAHKKVLTTIMNDEKRVKDPDVKKLADSMVPAVEQHLKAATQQLSSAKAGSTSGK